MATTLDRPQKPAAGFYINGRFIGEQGSAEHKAHIAWHSFPTDLHDAIQSIIELDDPDISLDERATAALHLQEVKDNKPAAYAAAEARYNQAVAAGQEATLKAQRRPFDPTETSIGNFFDHEPPKPRFIVDRLLPAAHGVENAIGGAGKTTRHIWEAIHIILGRDLYGQRVLQPGGVLIVTKEDDRDLFRHRIHGVVSAMPDLTEADRRLIGSNLHLLVLTGTDERLALADRAGNLIKTTLAERICTAYAGEGLALVEFDPLNMFGPGERYVNDGEAATLNAMASISQSLVCCVRATSHVSKMVGREGISDAHSGRGGSALGDNSRFVWNYFGYDSGRKVAFPHEFASAADAGELYYLDIAKLTAARSALDRIWIHRQGFAFNWSPEARATPQQRLLEAANGDDRRVLDYLRQSEETAYFTARELESKAAILGLSQRRVRDAVRRLQGRNQVIAEELPAEYRKGGRKTYLKAVPEVAEALDTSRPIADQILAEQP